MNHIRGRVTESGRISLPADFRKTLGLDHGGDVIIELDGNDIRIRSVNAAIARAQALSRQFLGNKPGASVDDFIAERRREAERE